MSPENIAPEIAKRGFAIVEGLLNQDAIAGLLSALAQTTGSGSEQLRPIVFPRWVVAQFEV